MFAVKMLLQRKMHHVGVGPAAVPVLFIGRDPYRVAGADFAHRTAPQRNAPHARDDMQGLAEGMSVPCGARARLETHEGPPDPRRRRRLDDGVLPYRSG